MQHIRGALARSHPLHRGRGETQPRTQLGNQTGSPATWAPFWALKTWGQQKGMGCGKPFGCLEIQAGGVEVDVVAFSNSTFFCRRLHL